MISYEGWVKGTRSTYGNDPTEYNGADIDYCKNCGDLPKEYGDVCFICDEEFEEMEQSEFDEFCTEHNFNRKTYKFNNK